MDKPESDTSKSAMKMGGIKEDLSGPGPLFTMSDMFNFQLKLHGLHKDASIYLGEDSDADNISLPDEDPLDVMAAAAVNMGNRATKMESEGPSRPMSTTSWKRRHSVTAARKNNIWAEFYLSTGSSSSHIAGFLSFKDSDQDAEYFLNPVPKDVINQDDVYKDLLAVYNAVRFWSRSSGKISGKKLLIVCTNLQASKLLKKSSVKSTKITPQQLLLLQEINQIIRKQKVVAKVATITPEKMVHSIAYALARSSTSTVNKRRFEGLLVEQEKMRGSRFIAKEVIFPPVYL